MDVAQFAGSGSSAGLGSGGLRSHTVTPSPFDDKSSHGDGAVGSGSNVAGQVARGSIDKDLQCPICMEAMKDAFLTACGHSFCYSCITTHLNNRSNCPCCSHYLTHDQIFPNFTLNKLLKKAAANQLVSHATPTEHLKIALQQGSELSVKELDSLLSMLLEKKRRVEQEEAEMNMEILLEFLMRSRQQKQAELEELKMDLQFIREDISEVETRRRVLQRQREQLALNMQLLLESASSSQFQSAGQFKGSSMMQEKRGGGSISGSNSMLMMGGRGGRGMGIGRQSMEPRAQGGLGIKEAMGGRDAMPPFSATDAAVAQATVAKKKRVLEHFDDLQDCYLSRKRHMAAVQAERRAVMDRINAAHTGGAATSMMERMTAGITAGGASHAAVAGSSRGAVGGAAVRGTPLDAVAAREGLDDFQHVLSAFTRFSRLKVIAELRHGDLFHSSNIVSSIEFDRDDEFFATAGVSRRIKVFEYNTVVNELADVHCPVVEMSTRSKLSCLSWNRYTKAQIASSDYEGIVTVWDVNACASVMEYEEHEKRAWSVDFSRTEPTRLVSGSDDGKVKIWCTRQESSTMNLDMKANICCVKFNPGSANYIAVGSADHHIHYFDLRNPVAPLHVFSGHRKAVSYVKFISPSHLASASTDSTLRLWDVQVNCLVRTLTGHTNEKNFVGLSVNSDFIACGSETNEVFVYYKAMSKPTAVHRFGSSDPLTGEESDDDASHFISAVCWKSDSPTMLAANSQGTIKVLTLAP